MRILFGSWIVCSVLLSVLCFLGGAATASATVLAHERIGQNFGGFTGDLDSFDAFGITICSLGDLDGVGPSTLAIAVGSSGDDDGGTLGPNSNTGAVWILFLASDGTVLSHQKISNTFGGLPFALADGDQFGISAESLGDLDGDGRLDLAVGALRAQAVGNVWILSLNMDGTVNNAWEIGSSIPTRNGAFGIDLSSLGDLDGAGGSALALAVGSNQHNEGMGSVGAVWIVFLSSMDTVTGSVKITDDAGGFPPGVLNTSDAFGSSVQSLGDLANDGTHTLAVGAVFDDDGEVNTGAVWILSLGSNGSVASSPSKISSTAGNLPLGSLDGEDRFGTSLSSPASRDLDGDGVADLVVGSVHDDDGGTNRGALWFLLLNRDGSVKAIEKVSDTEGGFSTLLNDFETLGNSVEFLGDLDGDGNEDVASGAVGAGGLAGGGVWVLFLDAFSAGGTVNEGAGAIENVLFVNGGLGTVLIPLDADITVDFFGASGGGTEFVLWAWATAAPGGRYSVLGEDDLGCTMFPTPLHFLANPKPFRCVRSNSPALDPLCFGVLEINGPTAVPWSITKGGGFSSPIAVCLQGLVEDGGSSSSSGFSVTNAVFIRVQ